MSEIEWVVLDEVGLGMPAEVIYGILKAQGIKSLLSQEGAGKAYGVTVGALGRTQILVPSDQFEKAAQVMADINAGVYAHTVFPPEEMEKLEEEIKEGRKHVARLLKKRGE